MFGDLCEEKLWQLLPLLRAANYPGGCGQRDDNTPRPVNQCDLVRADVLEISHAIV